MEMEGDLLMAMQALLMSIEIARKAYLPTLSPRWELYLKPFSYFWCFFFFFSFFSINKSIYSMSNDLK